MGEILYIVEVFMYKLVKLGSKIGFLCIFFKVYIELYEL